MTSSESPAQCSRTHEHSESNTYRFGSRRECVSCRRFWWRMYSRRKRNSDPRNWKVIQEPEELLAFASGLEAA